MAESAVAVGTGQAVHVHHEELGFWRTYVFSTDHKMIGRQFLFLGLFMMILGGLLALMIRWQLAWPETQIPGLRWVPEPFMYDGAMGPEFYNAVFTMHATIMIFFVVMPILVGCFGNFLIPLMIGARDMAFPVLNMLSFWVGAVSGVIMLAGFFVPGGHAAGGWTAYAPLTAVTQYTGVNWGQNIWCISLILLGISSLMGSINYITTIINMRAPGMTFFRLPLVIWSLFIVAILLLLALPVLTSALAMLLFDRMLGTSFFLPAGGGEPLLWQHLFWFFGHPEVYVLILPAMGVASEVLSVFARKPIFGYRAMAYSMIAIAFLSWIVWGHHMFQSGMNPALATSFMVSTMVIAVPSAIKTFNWLGTLWGGSIRFTTPMLHGLAFVSMFVIGGLSGIFMASTPVDIFIHDTYFIVAHIHYVVFGGSVFGIFAAIAYWFPKLFGRMMNETLGKIHFWLTFLAFNGTFFPMHILGVGGHMRRIYNPMQYEFLQPLQPVNVFITVSALVLGIVQIPFVINFFWSLFAGKKAERNPWQANTLEWTAPSPPPHGNWGDTLPVVYGGPYEYSPPGVSEDYLPQTQSRVPHLAAAH
ncbi:MAG: cytochrome c oxidase subunit I [candidate division NC10 bacterium RIFCSPLOWO2_12_FULL_66_18]|nr:MAG: cytochrome c oxidase subunit I [candidate division NC10 bacterium RIFCSPLOWO2_02_FULL_66_22]OGB95817.1 MAG: cytochrome c oxidase subunit I [candidate division NC10 bacterium RIFCSPLOWO2_12_FULL_66_18]